MSPSTQLLCRRGGPTPVFIIRGDYASLAAAPTSRQNKTFGDIRALRKIKRDPRQRRPPAPAVADPVAARPARAPRWDEINVIGRKASGKWYIITEIGRHATIRTRNVRPDPLNGSLGPAGPPEWSRDATTSWEANMEQGPFGRWISRILRWRSLRPVPPILPSPWRR